MFGGITIVCGILGTITGGLILDRMSSTISNAFKVSSVLEHHKNMLHLCILLMHIRKNFMGKNFSCINRIFYLGKELVSCFLGLLNIELVSHI